MTSGVISDALSMSSASLARRKAVWDTPLFHWFSRRTVEPDIP